MVQNGLSEQHSLLLLKYGSGLVWFGHSWVCWCIKYDPLEQTADANKQRSPNLYYHLTRLADSPKSNAHSPSKSSNTHYNN